MRYFLNNDAMRTSQEFRYTYAIHFRRKRKQPNKQQHQPQAKEWIVNELSGKWMHFFFNRFSSCFTLRRWYFQLFSYVLAIDDVAGEQFYFQYESIWFEINRCEDDNIRCTVGLWHRTRHGRKFPMQSIECSARNLLPTSTRFFRKMGSQHSRQSPHTHFFAFFSIQIFVNMRVVRSSWALTASALESLLRNVLRFSSMRCCDRIHYTHLHELSFILICFTRNL